jgi:hypothetical protein
MTQLLANFVMIQSLAEHEEFLLQVDSRRIALKAAKKWTYSNEIRQCSAMAISTDGVIKARDTRDEKLS